LEVLHCNLDFSPLKERATLLAYTSALAPLELGLDEHFLRAGATAAWTKLDSLIQPTFLWLLCDGVGTGSAAAASLLTLWHSGTLAQPTFGSCLIADNWWVEKLLKIHDDGCVSSRRSIHIVDLGKTTKNPTYCNNITTPMAIVRFLNCP
jgi:hypothetical protein